MEAAWCNNPFSNQHLSNTEYRKAFLKRSFGVPVDGFMDLENGPMPKWLQALDFADEREAAGRPVPILFDCGRISSAPRSRGPTDRSSRASDGVRKTAAVALKMPRLSTLSFLNERHKREEDTDVLIAIQDTIDSLSDG